jgi:hypothetical protein
MISKQKGLVVLILCYYLSIYVYNSPKLNEKIHYNTMSTEERLAQFLKESKDWQRKTTSIRGIFLLKIPRFKTSAAAESVAIEINPVNAATGSATKKRGIVIRSSSELAKISKILTDPKLAELAKKID